jgi:hypothetical protein
MGARARTDNCEEKKNAPISTTILLCPFRSISAATLTDYFGVHHSGGIERIDARGRR